MKESERFEEEAEGSRKRAEYFEQLQKEAVAKTKNRQRTNNIHDPEYCAYWAGQNRGFWVGLTSNRQIHVDDKSVNLPSALETMAVLEQIVDRAETMHRTLKNFRTKSPESKKWTQEALEALEYVLSNKMPKWDQPSLIAKLKEKTV